MLSELHLSHISHSLLFVVHSLIRCHDLLLIIWIDVHKAIWIGLSQVRIILFKVLVNQTKSDVIVELGDGEVQLVSVSLFQFLQETFSEGSNDTLLIVIDDILEELIDELNFEVGQIKSSIIIAVELIGNVQNYLVFFVLALRVYKFVDQSARQVLNLSMASDQ